MTICNLVLTPIIFIIRTLIAVVRFITETLCGWVTTTITVIREVAEKICSWLPWPLDKVCEWGTKLIEVLETITEWICEEVIKRIVDFIEIVFEYLIYVLKWVCWLIDWIAFRWIALLVCLAGIEIRKCIPVCLTILTDEKGNQTISIDAAKELVTKSNVLLRQCHITLTLGDIRIVEKPDLIRDVPSGFSAIFTHAFRWFSKNVCDCCSGVTVYFVATIEGGPRGLAIPGSNWILVAVENLIDDATIVHEIGHLADLWKHDGDRENVMAIHAGVPRTKLRKLQCCLIGSARFSHACGRIDRLPIEL